MGKDFEGWELEFDMIGTPDAEEIKASATSKCGCTCHGVLAAANFRANDVYGIDGSDTITPTPPIKK